MKKNMYIIVVICRTLCWHLCSCYSFPKYIYIYINMYICIYIYIWTMSMFHRDECDWMFWAYCLILIPSNIPFFWGGILTRWIWFMGWALGITMIQHGIICKYRGYNLNPYRMYNDVNDEGYFFGFDRKIMIDLWKLGVYWSLFGCILIFIWGMNWDTVNKRYRFRHDAWNQAINLVMKNAVIITSPKHTIFLQPAEQGIWWWI